MDRFLALFFFFVIAGCNPEDLREAQIRNIQVSQIGAHYQISFELNGPAFWEVEASDEIDDLGAFFTIAQNKPKVKEEGVINTEPLALNLDEDYIIRVLAYTKEDLLAGRAAIAYTYIDR